MTSSPESRFFGHPLQRGGIRTGSLDCPQPLGGEPCRAALVDTGSGLHYTVAVDRGGDIIDATYRGRSLAWLSPNGLAPANFAYHAATDWLSGWPGGLLTTCGPLHVGAPDPTRPHAEGLHGHHSHCRAGVLAVDNPAVGASAPDFGLTLRIDDSRMFGPHLQITRRISGTLGQPSIRIEDTVANLDNTSAPHHQLYHLNFGYPLLSPGAKLVLSGRVLTRWGTLDDGRPVDVTKQIPDVLDQHRGAGEGGLVLADVNADGSHLATVGLINEAAGLAVAIDYDTAGLEKLVVWQHFGPGSYVCGIEPLHGSLLPEDRSAGEVETLLEPGDTRRYALTIRVADQPDSIAALLAHDRPLLIDTTPTL